MSHTISPLESKVDAIMKLDPSLELNLLLSHIERAYYLFNQGVEKEDKDYFTDVVYRTNVAFDGCSKQAYKILANKSAKQARWIKAKKIEEYFKVNNILSDRVAELFNDYRENWRNESVHDYTVYFEKQQANTALGKVGTILTELLHQVATKLISDQELANGSSNYRQVNVARNIVREDNPTYDKSSYTGGDDIAFDDMITLDGLVKHVINIIELFQQEQIVKSVVTDKLEGIRLTENELMGIITAQLKITYGDNVKVLTQRKVPLIDIESRFFTDLSVEVDDFKFFIELKSGENRPFESDIEKSKFLLSNSNYDRGLLYVFDSANPSKLVNEEIQCADKNLTILVGTKRHT